MKADQFFKGFFQDFAGNKPLPPKHRKKLLPKMKGDGPNEMNGPSLRLLILQYMASNEILETAFEQLHAERMVPVFAYEPCKGGEEGGGSL